MKKRHILGFPCVTKHPPIDTVYTTYQMARGLKEIRQLWKANSLSGPPPGVGRVKIYKLVEVGDEDTM